MASPFEESDDTGMEVDSPAESTSNTALIPTDFFGGKELEPGTECLVRIERVLDGQVEVSYVPHESGAGEVEIPEEDSEMAGYMNE